MLGGPGTVLASFGVSVCQSVSAVPVGEQQSLSEDGGDVRGSCPPWQLERAPLDLGVSAKRVSWDGGRGKAVWAGARVPLGMLKCWGGKAGGKQGHPGGRQGLGEVPQGNLPGREPGSAVTRRGQHEPERWGQSQPAWGSSGRCTVPTTPRQSSTEVWG